MNREKIMKKLVDLRTKANETQADVAKDIEVSTSTYGMYEIGQRMPSDEVKIKIANHFGLTVQSIFFE